MIGKSGLLVLFVVAFAYSQIDSTTPATATPLSGGQGWGLVWSDEFEGSEIDSTKWTKQVSTKTRSPRTDKGISDWWWKEENAFLNGDGQLVLRVIKHDYNTMYCGSVNTNGRFEPTYGYYETRIQIADTSKATHTAFWFQGDNMSNIDGTANDGAEIDVFESAWTGDYTKSVVHIDGYGDSHQANTKQWSAPGIHSGYHIYGLEWTYDYLKIYYDGQLVTQYTTSKWVPRAPEYIWLSDGASFGDGDFQSQSVGVLTDALVDYVRVWQYVPETNPQIIVDDSDGSIDYSTQWGIWTENPGYNSTEHFSEVASQTATFTFTGTKAIYYGFKRKDLGYAEIYLDGLPVADIDCYNATAEYFVPLYETPSLIYGSHTLMVKVKGTKNAASSGSEVIVDAFGYYENYSGDLNNDGVVDIVDLSELGNGWLDQYDANTLQYLSADWLLGK